MRRGPLSPGDQVSRPRSLVTDHGMVPLHSHGRGYTRLRPKSTWFSYYQYDHDDEDGDYSGVDDSHYMSPVTQESHLTLSPVEDRVTSPCSELDMDPKPGTIGCPMSKNI